MSSFLDKYKRQPRLFIDLPTEGKFYSAEVCDRFESIPVFGMTAMDEMMLRTLDALFSGEATAQVIKSCIPDIKDPWGLVGYDIDYVLLSIRIATYGSSIPVTTKCPKCQTETEADINLQALLEMVNGYNIQKSFKIKDLEFILKPITYRQTTDFSVQSYTLQKQIAFVDQKELTDEDRDKELNDLLLQSSNLNLSVALTHIGEIVQGDNSEADPKVIYEWVKDNDVEFYNKIRDTILDMTESWKLPDFDSACTNEECKHQYKSNLEMDYANFFGTRSLHSRNLIS